MNPTKESFSAEEFTKHDIKFRVFKYENHFGFHEYAEIYYEPWGVWVGKVWDYSNIRKQYKKLEDLIDGGFIKKEDVLT